MLFLSEFPVFLLIAPANYTGIIIAFLLYITICLLLYKHNALKIQPLKIKTCILSVIIAIALGINFYKIWVTSSKVATIAAALNIATKPFLSIVSTCIAVVSVWGIYNIIVVLGEIKISDGYFDDNIAASKSKGIASENQIMMFSRRSCMILALILIAQFSMMIYYGFQKNGFHCDEIFTYELSNYEGTFLASDNDRFETWKSGKFYQDAVSASNNRFDYDTVWNNQSHDVHPPIYYAVIHTVSSFFPGTFSKWIGMAPNFCFCLLTTFVLYRIGVMIFGSKSFALLATGIWALSVGAMSSAVFIRMYAMLTFWCTLLVYLHLEFERTIIIGPVLIKSFVPLFLCTLAGILTQYYFLIFCFFFCGSYFVHLLLKKQWRVCICYVITELASIGCAILVFKPMMTHIFQGYRGQEALTNLLAKSSYISQLKTVLNSIIIENVLIIPAALILVLVLCRLLIGETPYKESESFNCKKIRSLPIALALCVTAIGYILLVTKIAPYQRDRYFMCIFPIISILITYAVFLSSRVLFKNKKRLLICSTIFAVVFTACSFKTFGVNYLYPDWSERDILSQYKNSQTIVLNTSGYFPFSNYVPEYINYREVFICSNTGDFSSLDLIKPDELDHQFLLYAYEFGDAENELDMFKKIKERLPVDSFERLVTNSCPVYLCTLEN